MSASPLWDRYHHLLEDYMAHGDEARLRAVVALSQHNALTLETTCGRLAASVGAVFDAYEQVGARRLDLDVGPKTDEARGGKAKAGAEQASLADRTIHLEAPGCDDGGHVVVEIRGERSGVELPVVRLDYVPGSSTATVEPIEPRQLCEVLTGLLGSERSRRDIPKDL